MVLENLPALKEIDQDPVMLLDGVLSCDGWSWGAAALRRVPAVVGGVSISEIWDVSGLFL